MFEQLHFIRPEYLWLFIPSLLVLWAAWQWLAHESGWQKVIDPRLIVHLLDQPPAAAAKWPVYVLAAALAVAIIAAAGPAWEKLPQPVQQSEDALVIALDMSLSMLATDVKPARITRARHKIQDILQRRKEGLTALVVYAGDAHAVVPFTDDAATIAAMLPALTPEIMPKLGSRPDLAVQLSKQMLQDAGLRNARLLLVSDGIAEQDIAAINSALGHNLTLSILGIGTTEGGPIPVPDGGFLQDQTNSIVVAQLTRKNFKELSKLSGGRYRELQVGPQDIDSLLSTDLQRRAESREIEREFDVWRDAGASLVLVLLPIALLAFRRGWLLSVMLLFWVQIPQQGAALEWSDLWLNKDQQARQALAQGDAERAAKLFEDPQWKASAQYKAGDFEAAAKLFATTNKYNEANALAREGRLQEAIAAYQHVLEQNPENEDAAFNRKLVEELLKQQQQSQQQEQDKQQNQGDQQNEQEQGDGQQQQDEQSGDGQQENQQPGQNGQQQNQQGNQQQNQDSSQQQARQNEHAGDQSQDEQAAGQSAEQHAEQQQDQNGSGEQPAEIEQGDGAEEPQDQTDAQQSAAAQAGDDGAEETEQQQALQQWLRKVPDDPGGLLRNKFLYQYEQNRQRQEYYDESSQIW